MSDERSTGIGDRFQTIRELWAMILERRQWMLLPVFVALVLLVGFVTVAEMPVLIPFFYAVF